MYFSSFFGEWGGNGGIDGNADDNYDNNVMEEYCTNKIDLLLNQFALMPWKGEVLDKIKLNPYIYNFAKRYIMSICVSV